LNGTGIDIKRGRKRDLSNKFNKPEEICDMFVRNKSTNYEHEYK
jgi:hypothetical protein